MEMTVEVIESRYTVDATILEAYLKSTFGANKFKIIVSPYLILGIVDRGKRPLPLSHS
jgi:hypothetical protein